MLYIHFKMSRQSIRNKNKDLSSSEESLPQQWTSLQKRVDYVESTIIKIQRRNQKLQKKVQEQNENILIFKREAKKMIEQVMIDKKSQLAVKEKQLEFENMKAELQDLHSLIKRIEKKNNQMIKQIKNSGTGGLSDSLIEDQIQEKVQKMLKKQQNQTQKAINQLRRMIKDQMRDQSPIDKKSNENILTNSRSKVSIQKSGQKSGRGSYTDLAINHDISVQKQKCKSPQQTNNASSRVSYLRQKLKEFEETNKKFQEKLDKREVKEQKKTVQKMKDFKNYLQQSESQLDQSNIQSANPHNVLTDSIQNWRNGQRYRYE